MSSYEEAGVSIEAGDKAVELMKVWIEKARRPEMVGGIGGFAGLFDASRAQGLRPAAARHQRRRRRHQGRDRAGDGRPPHHRLRPGRHARRRPGRLRRRAAVPHRLHRHRPRRTRAHRGDRPGHRRGVRGGGLRADRRRDRRAPRAARARRVRRGRLDHRRRRGRPPPRAQPGPARATPSSRWPAAGCTATATPWSGTCCSATQAGWALDRHVDELGRTLGEELLEPTQIYAKACLALARATRTHAMSHITGGGLAANLARVLPEEVAVTLDRGTWTPAAGLRPGRARSARWPATDLEQTLNMGVGMVALVDADDAKKALATPGRARASRPGSAARSTSCGAGRPGSVILVGGHPGWMTRLATRETRIRCAGITTGQVALDRTRNQRRDRTHV